MIDEIICHSLNETTILKLIDKFKDVINNANKDGKVTTYDASIVTIASQFDPSCLITSDKGMKNRHSNVYPNIFLFNDATDLTRLNDFLS